MNEGKIEYVNLEELSNTDYKISDGQANITSWPVLDESDSTVGKVRDLLFDPAQNAIRYIIVDLDESIAGPDEKAILIPIGYANLADDRKAVVIPVMSIEQYELMPRYIIGEVTRDTEMQIRSAIGSPAALRIEEEIVELEHPDFYQHHHFDRGNIIFQEFSHKPAETEPTIAPADREEERAAIHDLIDNSHTNITSSYANDNVAHQLHEQAGGTETGSAFEVTADGRIFNIEPQDNGTYRILEHGEKVGVIYAESGERGVQWATMDELDSRFVEVIGEAITSHNASATN